MPRFRIHVAPGSGPPEHGVLVLVREHDVRLERLHERPEALGARVPDGAPGREVDADPRAAHAGEIDRAYRGAHDGFGEKGVAGDVQVVAREPGRTQLDRLEEARHPAVGEHRPRAVRVDERDDDAVPGLLDGPDELHAEPLEGLCGEPARSITAPLAHPTCGCPERGGPRSDVRALAPGRQRHACGRVRIARDVRLDPDHDVERKIPERDHLHALRSSHGRRGRGAGSTRPSRADALVRPRRPRRRVRRRGRAASCSTAPAAAGAGGSCGVRGRAVLPRVARAGAQGRPVTAPLALR